MTCWKIIQECLLLKSSSTYSISYVHSSGSLFVELIPISLNQRDKAFKVYPWPCIGQVRFLNNKLPKKPYASKILPKLKQGATFLDAGCCFGQQLRYLYYYDHISPSQLYAFDHKPEFIDLGYDLFRDKQTFHGRMVGGDMLSPLSSPPNADLKALAIEGGIDVINVVQVLHSWDYEDQLKAAVNLVAFSRPKPGSLIAGDQMGSVKAGSYPLPSEGGSHYRHNVESFQAFWKEVGERTGTRWVVEDAGLEGSQAIKDNEKSKYIDQSTHMIRFCCERLE